LRLPSASTARISLCNELLLTDSPTRCSNAQSFALSIDNARKALSAHESNKSLRQLHHSPSTSYSTKENSIIYKAAVALVCRVEVDEDVDGGNEHFGENEDDDDPFEQFALIVLVLDHKDTDGVLTCVTVSWSFSTASRSPMTFSLSVNKLTRWSISR
jgi:hypothetical protein